MQEFPFYFDRIGRKHLLVLLVVFLTGVAGRNALADENAKYKKPVVIEVTGEINVWNAIYFENRLKSAKRIKADLVIVEIHSGGGELQSALHMVESLNSVDWAHTVAFVPKTAFSAAAVLAMACDEIRIAPTATIGDVGVILREGNDGEYRYASEKIISALVEEVKVLARQNGYPEEIAEAMIDKDKVLFVKNIDDPKNRKFLLVQGNPKTNTFKSPGEEWTLVEEGSINRFLTLSGDRAVGLGLASTLTADRDELATQLKVSDWKVYKYRTSDTWILVLNGPIVTGILITIALVALFFELSAPGLGAGGLIAGLCFVLFFWSRFAGGTADWLEVILFLSGIIFLLCEIFVIPGWGISGLCGLLLVGGSIFMASQDFVIPSTDAQWKTATTSALTIVIVFFVFLVAAGLISRKLGKIPVLSTLMLSPPASEIDYKVVPKGEGKPGVAAHPDVSVGDWGIAESLLRPAGRVRFGTKSFDVTSDSEFISAGQQVRVVSIIGSRIIVESVQE